MKVYDICHGKRWGEEGKKKWTKFGVLFTHDDGNMSIKFDYFPPIDEYLNVFGKNQQQAEEPPTPITDEDIPF